MTERPRSFLVAVLPARRRRSLFSARRFALMASVVAGVGAAVNSFSPQQGPVDVVTPGAAHAQVNNEVRKVERPIGFADIVERVRLSVISVKIKIADKSAKDDSANKDDELAVPAEVRRWSASSAASAVPDGYAARPRGGPRGGRGPVTGQGSGFFISADGFAVTNNHVVDGADKVEVTLRRRQDLHRKQVISSDPRTDLALIKVEGRTDFPACQAVRTQAADRRLGARGR